MASRDEVIQMTVRARDEASATLNNIQDNVGRLGQSASGLGTAFAALGGIAVAQQLAGAANEMMRLGAISAQTENALGALATAAGSNADAMVAAMNKAAMGTISNFDLMLAANRSLQFEIAKTPEEMAKLVELATALGRATGRSDTQALEDLSTGIARESRLILDNLGLLIDIEKVTKEYAATLGKAASELTSYERKQALLNEAFRQGATALKANRDAADSAATRIERFDASVKNLSDSWGRFIALTASGSLNNVTQVLDVINAKMSGDTGAMIDVTRRQIEEARAELNRLSAAEPVTLFGFNLSEEVGEVGRLRVLVADLEKTLMELTAAQGSANGSMQQAAELSMQAANAHSMAAAAAQSLGHAVQSAAMEASYLAAAALDGANGLSQLEAMAWSTASSLDMAAGAMARMNQVAGGLQAIRTQGIGQLESTLLRIAEHGGDADQLAATYGQVSDQIFNMGLSMENTAEAQFANKLAVQSTLEPYQQQLDSILEAERASNKLARSSASGAQQLSQEFSNLQSKVSSVLSGAFNVDVGVDTESILGREDAINEDARRLADVAVNGFNSPWYGYLKDKFPDTIGAAFEGADPKTAAAKLLKDFEDGLRPELINKDMAKERVRRMLIGEANTKAMVDEIAKELATEMGISINKVRAAAGGALGLADTATAGAAGEGVPVDIKPIIDQTLLQPITNLTANPQNVVVKLDTATVDGTAIAGELAAKIAISLSPTITWTDENVNAARTMFAGYGFQAYPTITWDATMLATAQTYIASVAFPIAPAIVFDATNLETARTTLQNVAFEINPLVSFANSIDLALTTFAGYSFTAYPSITWDTTMLERAQTYIASVAFPINPSIQFDVTNIDTARTTLQSYAFTVNPLVAFDNTNIDTARTTLQSYAFSVQPTIDFTADLANAQTRLQSYAFQIDPSIGSTGVTPLITWDNANIDTARTTLQSIAFEVNPLIAFDGSNVTTAQTLFSGYLFTLNPYIDFTGSNLEAAKVQFAELFTPAITPTISLFGADGAPVDYSTPAQMLAQGFSFAFMTEFDAFNPGAYVVEQLSAKIAENYQALDEGARGMGQRWGSMFLSAVGESVPIPLIELLVTLVTPGVKDKLSQQASQTGANNAYLPIYNQ